MKNRINKKGFGLVAALMIILVLFIMAAGFFQVTDYSRKSVDSNIKNLRLYWAAESASSYNVNWWVNLPLEARVNFPSTYTYTTKGSVVYNDIDGPQTAPSNFLGGTGITNNGSVMYLHKSSLLEGNTGNENSQLSDVNGNKLLLVRYKGPRKDKPEQAVWILDSYAWDPSTGDIANIVLSNVFNIKLLSGTGPFQNGELINQTLANAGFHGVKGRFNEQDIRYGNCYFAGLVHFDYKTGAVKYGPTFYGMVKSAATTQSWYKKSTTYFPGTSMYSHGLGINDNINNIADATMDANKALRGGYQKLVTPLDLSNVTWNWADVVKYGPANGIYFLEPSLFGTSPVDIRLRTVIVGGVPTTVADIYKGAAGTPTKTINISSSSYKGIAVPETFGEVGIRGVSTDDFTLITQKDAVNIMDDFYLYEMTATRNWAKAAINLLPGGANQPPPALSELQLAQISAEMLSKDPKGHLAVVAGLDIAVGDKTPPIWIPDEKIIFSTSSYISQYGELGAKGVGNTALRFYNVGAIMTLEKQEIASGPSDTAQKWPKVYIEDLRYSRPDEPLPPFCGAGPSAMESDNFSGLNPEHVWSKPVVGNTSDWRTVVWRNLPSFPN